MFRRFTKKRTVVVLGAGALAVLGAVAAFAFFTGSGSGTGTATVASDSAVNINNVSFGATQLWPGHGTPVTFTVSNPSSSVPLSVSQVIADTSTYPNGVSIPDSTGTTQGPACTSSYFTFAPVPIGAELTAGGSSVYTGTLAMSDAQTINQDQCKGQAPSLHLIVKNP
jgi:hypothetical protein